MDEVKKKEIWNTPIPFKPLKYRRILMWINLLGYTVGWYMCERMYYVNMPIPSEPLWSNPTPLRQSVGDTMAFDRAPRSFKAPKIASSRVVCPVTWPSSSQLTVNAAAERTRSPFFRVHYRIIFFKHTSANILVRKSKCRSFPFIIAVTNTKNSCILDRFQISMFSQFFVQCFYIISKFYNILSKYIFVFWYVDICIYYYIGLLFQGSLYLI